MKYCKVCKINILDKTAQCPLCGGALQQVENSKHCYEAYPETISDGSTKSFVVRLLTAITVFVVGFCLVSNYMTGNGHWSLIVLLSAVYLWLALRPIWRPRRNMASIVLKQTLLLSAYVLMLDLTIGWHGWSVDIALPIVILCGIVTACLFYMIRKEKRGPYALFMVISAVLGIIPLICCLLNWSNSVVLALISFGAGIVGVLLVWVFGGPESRNEFLRRLKF